MISGELVRTIKQLVARAAWYGFVSTCGSLGRDDEIQGRGDSDKGTPVRRLWPFGLRSVPVAGAEAAGFLINAGRSAARVMVAADSMKHGPKEMKEGETALYSAFDAVILLDKDGNITVIPKAGAKVKLGSGTDSELDQLVTKKDLNDQLKIVRDVFDEHTHPAGGLASPSGAVTGETAFPTTGFGSPPAVTGSPNVLGKKP